LIPAPQIAQVVSSVFGSGHLLSSLNINKDDRYVALFAGTVAFFGLWLDVLGGR